ncbi:ATP-binding protein [Streptomyces sp. NPDC005438]|uniref:ATP-binding protein n=1 Tax=Streptomyces sp. NPDC005438 TaxID=3156880 RepID=UPI0033AC4D8F
MGTEGSTVLEPLWHSLPPLGPFSVSGSASRGLPARYEAVKCARDFTRLTLCDWKLATEFDSVALVVSELVTNALRHGLTSDARGDTEPVRLHLMLWGSRLVCAVRDPSGQAPRLAPEVADPENPFDVMTGFVDFDAESGRGLQLVRCFADSWGWQPLQGSHTGKVVWALFHLRD